VKLPPADSQFLNGEDIAYRTFDDGSGTLNVELLEFPLPPGLNADVASVLFRLSGNYPDTPPDMWWVIPHLTTASGGRIQATESVETFDERQWQRWSRHLDANAWQSGVDGLESYIRLLRNELEAAAA
jgi:hypothetical protein